MESAIRAPLMWGSLPSSSSMSALDATPIRVPRVFKQVHEQEGEHDGKEVEDADAGEIRLEHLTKGLAQGREVKADKSGGDHAVHAASALGT